MSFHFILVDRETLGGKPWVLRKEGCERYFLRARDVEEIVFDDATACDLLCEPEMLRAIASA